MAKYALLIGVSSHHPHSVLAPSPTAKNDVVAMEQMLLHPEMGGFAEVKLVLDPDRMAMEEEIEAFFRKCGRQDLAVMFYSGRGLQDDRGQSYFATGSTRVSADGELVRSSAMPAGSVQGLIGGRSPQQQVMILDCGFNRTDGEHAVTEQADAEAAWLRQQLAAQGRVVMLGAGAIAPTLDLSPYTHFVVEGVTSGAAAQRGNAEVSIRDLHDYARRCLQATLPAAHPELIALREEDYNIRLARVPQHDPHQRYREQVEHCLHEGSISPVGRMILDRQKVMLGLAPGEALAIENEALRPYRDHTDRVSRYRKALVAALELGYPLGDRLVAELKELQALLNLDDAELEALQQAVMQPYAARHDAQQQRVQRYEAAFQQAIALEYPLSDRARQALHQLQTSLNLTDAKIAPLETHLLQQDRTQREHYHANIRRFEQAWLQAARVNPQLTDADRASLEKLQHSLGIHASHAAQVRQRVQQQLQAEHADRQQRHTRYAAAFHAEIAQAAVLSKPARDRLQRLQHDLNLPDAAIIPLEERAIAQQAATQQHQANLERYRRACLRLMQEDDPLSDSNQQQLKRLQADLHLTDAEVAPILQQLHAQAKAQHQQYQDLLKIYQRTYKAAIAQEFPLGDSTRQRLTQAWQAAGLRTADVQAIEYALEGDVARQHEANQDRHQRYQRAYEEAMSMNGALDGGDRDRLLALAQTLDISPDTIADIEQQVEERHHPVNPSVPGVPRDAASANSSDSIESMIMPPPPPDIISEPAPPMRIEEEEHFASDDSGIDYAVLQGYLQDQQWKAADRETQRLLLRLTRREKEDWLSPDSLLHIPCADLNTISRLWDDHSSGHFGFAAQERLYNNLDSQWSEQKRVVEFALSVNWMFKAASFYPMFRAYNSLDFNLSAAHGHLPALWYWRLSPMASLKTGSLGFRGDRSYGGADIKMLANLMQRLRNCRI